MHRSPLSELLCNIDMRCGLVGGCALGWPAQHQWATNATHDRAPDRALQIVAGHRRQQQAQDNPEDGADQNPPQEHTTRRGIILHRSTHLGRSRRLGRGSLGRSWSRRSCRCTGRRLGCSRIRRSCYHGCVAPGRFFGGVCRPNRLQLRLFVVRHVGARSCGRRCGCSSRRLSGCCGYGSGWSRLGSGATFSLFLSPVCSTDRFEPCLFVVCCVCHMHSLNRMNCFAPQNRLHRATIKYPVYSDFAFVQPARDGGRHQVLGIRCEAYCSSVHHSTAAHHSH